MTFSTVEILPQKYRKSKESKDGSKIRMKAKELEIKCYGGSVVSMDHWQVAQ